MQLFLSAWKCLACKWLLWFWKSSTIWMTLYVLLVTAIQENARVMGRRRHLRTVRQDRRSQNWAYIVWTTYTCSYCPKLNRIQDELRAVWPQWDHVQLPTPHNWLATLRDLVYYCLEVTTNNYDTIMCEVICSQLFFFLTVPLFKYCLCHVIKRYRLNLCIYHSV